MSVVDWSEPFPCMVHTGSKPISTHSPIRPLARFEHNAVERFGFDLCDDLVVRYIGC